MIKNFQSACANATCTTESRAMLFIVAWCTAVYLSIALYLTGAFSIDNLLMAGMQPFFGAAFILAAARNDRPDALIALAANLYTTIQLAGVFLSGI